MTPDYFVIGPHVAIRSCPPNAGAAPSPVRLDFAILARNARASGHAQIGELVAELRQGRIEIAASMKSRARAADRDEAVQLAAGVCSKLAPVQVFARQPAADAWRLVAPPAAEDPDEPAKTMEALYRDPFRVVWNFEPMPWELIGPFATELQPLLPDVRVLDLGCGLGNHAIRLEEMDLEVHGVDVAASAIEMCRKWVRHPDRYHVASVGALPFEEAFFDAALDVGCLHCVAPDLLEPGIAELARVLRPGGLLYSRFFKPRGPAWLDAQQFQTDRIGLAPADLAKVLDPFFEIQVWEDAQLLYVRAVRRPAPEANGPS